MASGIYDLDINLAPLHQFNQDIQQLLKGLNTQQLEKAKQEIAKYLRSSMRKRITRQENVDGSAFQKRKPLQPWEFGGLRERMKHGRLRKKMLTGFRDKAKVGIKIQGNTIQIGYFGWSGNLAYMHNEGRPSSWKRKSDGKRFIIPRPERHWVGVSQNDEREIQTLLQHILTSN